MANELELDTSAYMTLRDVVFKSLRDAILSGTLAGGERLMEKDLAQKLGVSRTPIREALRKLEIEGFIEMTPRKGAIVKDITISEIADVLEIRAVLEAFASKKACSNMDKDNRARLVQINEEFIQAVEENNVDLMAQKDVELHDLIYSAAGNERLLQIISNLREHIYKYRIIYLYDKKYIGNIIKEHKDIIDSILQEDASRAQLCASQHIQNQQKAIEASLKR